MRLAALLLLAAAGGFLLGRLTAPEAGGLRGQRPPPPAVAEPRDPAPAPAAPAAREAAAPPAAEGVVQPSAPIEGVAETGPSDEGLVEIDFEGFDGDMRAFAGWRTMRGGYEEYEGYADEGEKVVRFDLAPGICDVWWLDREGRRRGGRAAVETGKRTLFRAVGWETAPPIPEGLGVLDVEVAATWGGGLCCQVLIAGYDEQWGLETSTTGHGSTTLYPGRYAVWVGSRREDVAIVPGRATACRIAHRNEGDLLLDMGDELVDNLAVARAGEPLERRDVWSGYVDGVFRCGLVYLPEGEYDVYYVRDSMDDLGVRLGHIAVLAGRTSWLRCRLPPGGTNLRVTLPPGTQSQVCVVVSDGRPGAQMSLYEYSDEGESRFTIVLAPGHYTVTASAAGCDPKTIEVDVADHMVELDLALAAER